MKIIIDTNIIHKDFFLGNAQIISLCETAKICGIKVLVPQVVIDEVVNHYREKIDEANKDFEKTKSSLSFFYPNESVGDYFSSAKTDQLLKDYRNTLIKRLAELGIELIPYPKVLHEDLVKRDLARRKPFQESGKGYRDALIWESVLNKIEKTNNNPDIVFINKNTKDFFEKDRLHPDLVADIENKGLSPQSLEVHTDISKVIEKHIKPRQASLDSLKTKYAGKDCIGTIDINSYIIDKIACYIPDGSIDNIPYFQSGMGRYMENVDIYGISDLTCKITDIRLLNDNQIIVDVDSTILLDYFAYLHKYDSYLFDDKNMPNIVDYNLNRHYMEVQDSIKLPIKISLIVDKDLKNINSHSVTYQ